MSVKKERLKEITHDLDANHGGLSIRLHTLKNVSEELNSISIDVFETDKTCLQSMGVMLLDIDHKIEMLADLLRYTVEDLSGEVDKTGLIKETYFDLLVRNADK